ncbi:uncharacterized protein [Nicotiana tomentosiformis]|uniref:uncharacterized protein n=1 Tax=Nicotiana tomentosiformis TaxID=4098 RepID=UPI00388C7189
MPPSFDMMEDDIPFTQEAEMMQEVGAILKNVRDTYSQPSALAGGCGQNLRSSGSAKGSIGKKNLVGESKNHNSTASEQNKLAHNSTNLMPPSFDLMEDDISLAQEDEMMQDLCEPEKQKKVRGKNKNKDVAELKPGEKFRVNFYNNRVVGKHQASFSRHLGILVRDRNMCSLQVHSWKNIGEDKLEHMWRAVTAEIQEPIQSEPSLTNIEVIERCFGPQNKSHVVGLGGGITTKELKGGSFSKAAILIEAECNSKRKRITTDRAECN